MFELRTYATPPGRLDALLARFRDHTVRLFARHGMTSVGYWVPAEGPQDQLVYLLAFPSREAAGASWAAFRQDPDWHAVRKASEEKAGGSLTVRGGVRTAYLKAVDFSPLLNRENEEVNR